MIDIDFTLGIQLVNFFIMLWFLNRFVFRPILKTADDRESKIKELEERSKLAAEKLEEATASYENGVVAIRHEASETVASTRKEAQDVSARIREKARKEYKSKVDKAALEIQEEVEKVSSDLKKDIGGFAETLATKILGRQAG